MATRPKPGRLRLELDDPLPDPWEVAAETVRDTLERTGAQEEQERAHETVSRKPLEDYAVDYVPVPRVGRLDLDRFPWQRELLSARWAEDREGVIQKATQVGASTLLIRWILWHVDLRHRVGLYTFPTAGELGDFSRQRIAPVIRASDYLRSRMDAGDVDRVDQKQIGPVGWLYFRGTEKPIDSVDADVAVFDEYDTSDQDNIAASEYRVTGPMSAGLIRRLGVPSIPGFGISKLYDESDQRVWTVKCEGCGEWNPMRGYEAFQRNVDQEEVRLVCGECRADLDVRIGEWVAKYPDRQVRGYHVPKLIVHGVRLGKIIENSKKTRPEQRTHFFTRDLGEGYAPAEGRLSREAILANVRPDLHPLEGLSTHALVTMGVDMASSRALNVVVEEAIDEYAGRKVFVGEVDDEPGGRTAFETLCFFMQAYGVKMAAVDNAPDGRFSQALAARFPGRVYRVGYYSPAPGGRKDPPPWIVDDDEAFVSLHRVVAIDATLERFRLQRALMPPLDMLPADYPDHLQALYRRKEEQKNGNVKVSYVKTGPDDYAHAEVYNLAAIELYWRNSGLSVARGEGPVPITAVSGPYERSGLSDWESEPEYRPGFD